MPLVSLSGVGLSYGARTLLDSVNLTVATGTRMALVGPNGSGKTTLMRIMASQIPADVGSVVVERGTRVSYVPQSGVVHGGSNLREEAEKAFAYGAGIQAELDALQERLGSVSPGDPQAETLLWKHHELQERLEASGYHRREEAIQRVLTGLGFSLGDLDRPGSAFSAGWQMRIALGRAILETPDILLLDEPTNYLDIEARDWLEGHLSQFPGGLLLVSHDRYFLDVVVTAVAEIYMARVSVISGNYTHYEEARAQELAAIAERWKQQQEEIARAESFITRFRYKATKARQVQSRITALEKMERIEIPPLVKGIHFTFPKPPHSGQVVLTATSLAKAYGGRPVFRGVDLEVTRGEKLVVVGVNGAGKSTLLRIIAAREPPDQGELRLGAGVVPAFYSQENADTWLSERQALEEVEAAAPTSLIPELRTILGAFLFRGDDVFKPVSVLSGGERSRLALLLLLLHPANLLILDEPTNHLDLSSKDVLLAALSEFPGTVIFVSHDRHFIEHLATRVLEVKLGAARSFPGDYEYYLRRTAQEQSDGDGNPGVVAPAAPTEAEESATQRARLEDKRLKSTLRSLEREEESLMARLEELEEDRRRIEQTMALPEAYADGARMRDLDRELKANVREHERATARWEEVASALTETKGRIAALKGDRVDR